ncbi:MAG TPA: glycosyltransferase family 2 protein [Candidatus Limnocylindrales bacterium]
MADGSGTPPGWRLAAAALLGGGFACGVAATGGGRLGRAVTGLAVLVATGMTVPLARASRRPPIPPSPAGLAPPEPSLTFSIVVAARDEAAVLPRLVADVAAQDHRDASGAPCFELLVVDDRSTDGTGAAAVEAAERAGIAAVTRVVRREGDGLADGKGAALTAAQPDACRGDVVLVLDGDARIGPDFLRRAAAYFMAGAAAVTARRRIMDAGSSQLAAAQADEQTLDGELQRGRWALGGCSEFRGDGIMVRRDLLAAVGGWRAAALTEDIDLSSRIAAARGERVAWAIDAEVWEEPVRSWGSLWHQRRRWAEGALRRAFEHGPAVLRSDALPLGARLDFAAYAGQLAVPPLVLGAAAGAAAGRRRGPLLGLLTGYLLASGILGYDALRWETAAGVPPRPAARLGRALRVSLFSAIWLAALPRAAWDLAVGSGRIRYVKMEHNGGDPSETRP